MRSLGNWTITRDVASVHRQAESGQPMFSSTHEKFPLGVGVPRFSRLVPRVSATSLAVPPARPKFGGGIRM